MSNCKYCGKSISWFKEKNKYVPVELTGEIHECDEYKKSKKQVKKISVTDLTPEEIARYEQNINKKIKKN